MTPQAEAFLAKARLLLGQADTMLDVRLYDAVGRNAYLAGFHAAQAYIFEHDQKTLKTHNGVQSEFLRLTKDARGVDPNIRGFLSRAYNLKSVADYETGPDAEISPERAARALGEAKAFVAWVTGLIETA